MPDLSPTTKLLQGFNAITDSGFLKQEDGEYSYLQNIRGWGSMGQKRRGVQSIRSFSAGIMGWFDPYIDGDGATPDLIMVLTNDGSLTTMTTDELETVFDIIHLTGVPLYLQSPDLNWWDVSVVAADGTINPTVVAAPASHLSADQYIAYSQTYGFVDANGTWKLSIDTYGVINIERYPVVGGVTEYSTVRAFATGYGPIFGASDGNHFKMSIANDGAINTTVV